VRITTKRGYDFGEVSSAMQKAIRRGDTRLAGYWALELWASGYGNYVWKRLLTVSAEDVWGLITGEIKALHDSYAFVNKTVPSKQPKGRIFISKAVILLCAARKSRDADHLQNIVYDALAGIDADHLAADLLKAGKEKVPDYAFDCHTLKGKRKGKTKADFFREEQNALKPFQPGLFDDLPGPVSRRSEERS
jgi:replication-associated recombination protein RarA